MAKFSSCYQLCPLIDHKSFVGVSDESVNCCVIITLGKNMVIRYKLPDQKQVSSWSSRDKLSAPVVYDCVKHQYIGVFNASQISTWDESCVELNSCKKLKFATPIDRVITSSGYETPVVVFRCGQVLPLHQALDRRKLPLSGEPPLSKDEAINDAHLITLMGSVVVALFTSATKGEHFLHLIPLEEGVLTKSCLKLERSTDSDVLLMGHTLVTYESCYLLTVWSDGRLFSQELPLRNSNQFPGRELTTITDISAHHKVALVPLSPIHVAIYGADASEEGALLFIFNTQLCVTQCKQSFKLYTTPARLWTAGDSAIIMASGQYLSVVPFHLGTQRLAALVGSQVGEASPAIAVDWGSCSQISKKEQQAEKSHLQKLIHLYMEEGMSQRMISQSLFIPTLDAKDIDGLTWLLETLTDIPESCIIGVLSLCLEDIEKNGYRKLLRMVLSLPVTPDFTTLGLLRHKLKLPFVLTLLRELSDAMIEHPGNPQLIEWATLLLDAHYQQYLLSRDENVIQILSELKTVVDNQIEDMEVWQELEPLLLQLHNKKGLPDPSHFTNTTYSIEQIKLY